MMNILGIVGSPHKNGLTSQLVAGVLAGAKSAGACIETMYLADYDLKACCGCKAANCWSDAACRFDDRAHERNHMIARADALVYGAPVYIHDINGLSKDFIDKVRIPPRGGRFGPFLSTNGKPALGITIAGGTGKGVLTSLQAIYYGFFFLCGFRAVEPMPVTQFNFSRMSKESLLRGKALVEAARHPKPFSEDGMADRLAYYEDLWFIGSDPIDDNLYIVECLLNDMISRGMLKSNLSSIEAALGNAKNLIASGRKQAAAEPVWNAYRLAVEIWEASETASDKE